MRATSDQKGKIFYLLPEPISLKKKNSSETITFEAVMPT